MRRIAALIALVGAAAVASDASAWRAYQGSPYCDRVPAEFLVTVFFVEHSAPPAVTTARANRFIANYGGRLVVVLTGLRGYQVMIRSVDVLRFAVVELDPEADLVDYHYPCSAPVRPLA